MHRTYCCVEFIVLSGESVEKCFSFTKGNRKFDNMHLSTKCEAISDEICFVNKINCQKEM